MSDPRNVAHAKKVTQEKKHGSSQEAGPHDGAAAQPGKKPAAAKKKNHPATEPAQASTDDHAAPSESPVLVSSAALESSLAVLAKLKELEFHSRASLERLAELALIVEDELKQQAIVDPLADVYAAQSAFQTKLTALIEDYKAECDRLRGKSD